MMKKIIAGVLGVLMIIVVGYLIYFVNHYRLYDDYKKFLSTYKAEKGSEFKAISEDTADVQGMVLVSENDNYKLYTNTETTEIAVWDKKAQTAIYSNPKNRNQDMIATSSNKSELQSTLNVEYYTSDSQKATINNYDLSIANEQFEVEQIENGIRYVYTLENAEEDYGLVPEKISEERMQSLVLDKLESAGDRKQITGKYKLTDGYYVLSDAAKDNKIGMKRLGGCFEKAGYTAEDYAVDMEGSDIERVSFTIPLEYRLEEDGLKVSVPASEIKEGGSAKISNIEVLKFFGAGEKTENGQLFVPNGSGSLIYFNNGKQEETSYSQHVYGIDPVSQSYTVVENTETIRMPIFGIINDTSKIAILGVIEEGDALASVLADVSGRFNSYNYTYASFNMREAKLLSMKGSWGQTSNITSVEKDFYARNYTIHYSFLQGEDASYSGLAKCYREKLISEGKLGELETTKENTFFLNVMGVVETEEHFLGVPYDGQYAMTTFAQAQEIVEALHEKGVDGINLNYKGWFNGGIYHDVADKVSVSGKLGGVKELQELKEFLQENGDNLTLDVAFQKVSSDSERFNALQEGSKYYTGSIVSYGEVNPVNYSQTYDFGHEELMYTLMSPKYLTRYVSGFVTEFKKDFHGYGISLRDLGDILSSDKKRTELINRQEAQEIVTANLQNVKATGSEVTVSGGNAYAWAVADNITEVSIGGTDYRIIDEHIPFYQMVIHGRITYSGGAWNIGQPKANQERILNYIEYGVMPKYTMAYADTSNLSYTSSEDQYSVCYKDWIENAAEVYQIINSALGKVAGAEMTNHLRIEEDLVKVEYSNGTTIYINYSSEQKTMDGITIDAMNYAVKEG